MSKAKKYIFFSLLLLAIGALNAQNQKQYIQVGDKYFNANDFYGAAENYAKALNIGDATINLLHKYATSLRNENEYQKAAENYLKMYKMDHGRTYPKDVFYLAEMYKYLGDYRNAGRYFHRSLRFFRRKRTGYFYQKITQEMASCNFANAMKDSLSNIKLENAGNKLNTTNSEFSSHLLNDTTMLFSSLRSRAIKNKVDSNYTVKVYRAFYKGNTWKTEGLFQNNLGFTYQDIGNAVVSPDDNYIYCTVCDTDKHCEIWRSTKQGNHWLAPQKIEKINGKGFNTTQPFPCKIDGKGFLFFASNRPGGKGKMDIWYSYINAFGDVSAPINAGDSINSIGNEITPFYDNKTHTLYFSSDWYKGFGGFDIFKSKGTPDHFQHPKNMLRPVNSSVNDLYFVAYPNFIFLASNRTGSMSAKSTNCCNDIYYKALESATNKKDTFSNLDEMNKYLPLSLYFDNDRPNPRSHDTTTNLDYVATYIAYNALQNTYENEYSTGLSGQEKKDAISDIDGFFDDYVHRGLYYLQKFTPLLLDELKKGYSVELTIKGFASPLSKSDYNVNLSLRRISSLINYLKRYPGGSFTPYIDGTAKNGARLTFKKVPYGEYEASNLVSDNINDLKHSVYSRKAALERKIEIIAIKHKGNSKSTFSGDKIYQGPKTKLLIDSIILPNVKRSQPINFSFKIENVGDTALRIFSFAADSNSVLTKVKITFPKGNISPGKTAEIKISCQFVKTGKVKIGFNMRTNEGKLWRNFYVRATVK